jgi:hypothetical protein
MYLRRIGQVSAVEDSISSGLHPTFVFRRKSGFVGIAIVKSYNQLFLSCMMTKSAD